MKRIIVSALVAVSAAVGFAEWDTSKEGQIAYQRDGKDVWRFHNTGAINKPFFDPLCVVGGPSLTWARPADHVWHYGLWFSWKYINGLNYWEEKGGKAEGVILQNALEKTETMLDGSITIGREFVYDREPLKEKKASLVEERTITISAPAEDGSYYMDWKMVFTALVDVKLDRTPIPGEQGGQSWGGYAGLSMRFADGMKDVETVATGIGRVTRNKDNRLDTTAAAMEQSGIIDGKPYGVAILAHPDNPRAPGDWYALEGGNFNFFNAAFLLKEPYTLPKGETLTLCYRVHIHPGRWGVDELQARAESYAAQPLKIEMRINEAIEQ
ncbi:MAG: PmoA family protein [Kiritimatiellaeota bacterium]|nr:PmoA family protein [Kiritimatiellota bacterium]